MGQDVAKYARFVLWLEQVSERPAVKKDLAVSAEARSSLATGKEARKMRSDNAPAERPGGAAHSLLANNSRPISMRLISLVPAPIS
jgi:hypothetical protein